MKTGIKKLDLQGLVTLALFVAMDVVLGKISFGSLTLKAGLGFIGSALLAYYFGPLWGGIGALVSDLLRSAIFGVDGGFRSDRNHRPAGQSGWHHQQAGIYGQALSAVRCAYCG